MTFEVTPLAKEVTTEAFAGTGAVQLAGTPSAQLWARKIIDALGDGNYAEFMVRGTSEWERFIGKVQSGTPEQVTREIVVANHLGTTALVNFASGVKDVILIGSLLRGFAHGQCQLRKSGANVVLSPFHGDRILVNRQYRQIPNAGITLAPTGLTANTTYQVYLYDNAGTLTLEALTNARALDTLQGYYIKSGDVTRTWVGALRVATGPAFVDSITQRGVVSAFNPEPRPCFVAASASTGATSATKLGGFDLNVLNLPGYPVLQRLSGMMKNDTAGRLCSVQLGVGGTAQGNQCRNESVNANDEGAAAMRHAHDVTSDWRTYEVFGHVDTGTGTFDLVHEVITWG